MGLRVISTSKVFRFCECTIEETKLGVLSSEETLSELVATDYNRSVNARGTVNPSQSTGAQNFQKLQNDKRKINWIGNPIA